MMPRHLSNSQIKELLEPEARKRINTMLWKLTLVTWGIPIALFVFLMIFFPKG